MNAFSYVQDQVILEFTLALLKDTGFYDVNYYTGGLMKFGKNVGYNFFKDDCNKPFEIYNEEKDTNRKSLFKSEFCASKKKNHLFIRKAK